MVQWRAPSLAELYRWLCYYCWQKHIKSFYDRISAQLISNSRYSRIYEALLWHFIVHSLERKTHIFFSLHFPFVCKVFFLDQIDNHKFPFLSITIAFSISMLYLDVILYNTYYFPCYMLYWLVDVIDEYSSVCSGLQENFKNMVTNFRV